MSKEKSNIIPGDTEVCEFDSVSTTTVYTGGLSDLKIADGLKWKVADRETCEALQMEVHTLRLSDIVAQLPDAKLITIINESPLDGEIWQYGNYRDGKWYRIGELRGYA